MNTVTNTQKAKTRPEGTWTIAAGKSIDETPYSGTVQIHPMGKVYTLSWLTGLADYSGLAFFEDGHIFAGCGPNSAYGITLYKINGDGTLDGKWITPLTKSAIETEKAVGGTADRLDGSYQIGGTMAKIGNYEGILNIAQSGDTYQMSWSVGTEYRGIGLRVGDWLVAAWGEGDVFCLHYEIEDAIARGRWALVGHSTVGVETLHRIC